MAHQILPGPHPEIVVMQVSDQLTHEDMTADEALGLNKAKLYVLLDVSRMKVNLPDKFLDGALNSFFMNENLIHMAIYLESSVLRVVAGLVAKAARRQEKMSIHSSYAAAEAHLLEMIKKAGDSAS